MRKLSKQQTAMLYQIGLSGGLDPNKKWAVVWHRAAATLEALISRGLVDADLRWNPVPTTKGIWGMRKQFDYSAREPVVYTRIRLTEAGKVEWSKLSIDPPTWLAQMLKKVKRLTSSNPYSVRRL